MAELVEGTTRAPSYQAAGTARQMGFSELGGNLMSALDPDLFQLAKSGVLYFATHTVATAVAPLQIVPTTTAAFVINNVDTATSAKLLVVLFAGCHVASGTSDTGTTLFAQVGSTALATQLTANGSGVTRGLTRGGTGSSVALADMSKTVAGGWAAIGATNNAANTTPGAGLVVPLGGMFVVPPTYAFGLHALSGAGTTSKYLFSAIWAEVQGTTP